MHDQTQDISLIARHYFWKMICLGIRPQKEAGGNEILDFDSIYDESCSLSDQSRFMLSIKSVLDWLPALFSINSIYLNSGCLSSFFETELRLTENAMVTFKIRLTANRIRLHIKHVVFNRRRLQSSTTEQEQLFGCFSFLSSDQPAWRTNGVQSVCPSTDDVSLSISCCVLWVWLTPAGI